MTNMNSKYPFAALEAFQEKHTDVNTLDAILTYTEEKFISTFITSYFDGDIRKAREVYRQAKHAKELIMLLWANIKDTVASPYVQQGLFYNIDIPTTFIKHELEMPTYQRFFGNLNYRQYDSCRTIFGPAAYFIDLMRFIEKHIPQSGNDAPPSRHLLEKRSPGLFTLPLDCENTYSLIPYIDIVNEVLEAVVETDESTPDETIDVAKFPMTLPVNLPLEEIRVYLSQLKLDLQTIYKMFGVTDLNITREILALSPRDYHLLTTYLAAKSDRDVFYGIDTGLEGINSLENADVFMKQTSLSRSEMNTLLFGDLSNDEINAGLTRLFFINNTGDDAGSLRIDYDYENERGSFTAIAADIQGLDKKEISDSLYKNIDTLVGNLSAVKELYVFVDSPSKKWRVWDSLLEMTYTLVLGSGTTISVIDQPYDRLIGLSPRKLDRIYRFLRLARILSWSFPELDAAIQSFQRTSSMETVLRFDGVNDFVSVKNGAGIPDTQFTLEAWVSPSHISIHPIIAKGDETKGITDFSWWISPSGKLALFNRMGIPTYVQLDDSGSGNTEWKTHFAKTGSYPFVETTQNGTVHISEIEKEQGGLSLVGKNGIPLSTFSHVAAVANRPYTNAGKTYYQLAFYINGKLDCTWTLSRPIPFSNAPTASIRIGKDFNSSFFTGQMTEVRIWNSLRTASELSNCRFLRLHGRETNLAAYWPLVQSIDMKAHDFCIVDTGSPFDARDLHPGILGGTSHHSTPVWTQGVLSLGPLLRPISLEYKYQFDGSRTYIGNQLGINGSILALAEFTIEAWVQISSSKDVHPLVTFGQAGETPTLIYGLSVNKNNKLVLSSDSFASNVMSSATLSLNTLTYVAASVQGGNANLYVNDDKTSSSVSTIAPGATSYNLYLGRDFARSPVDGNTLHGTLQEVRIWNAGRTPDISRFHQLNGTEIGLVGYWRLDEPNPENLLALDRTFYQNHLYLGGPLSAYQPELIKHDRAILPSPLANKAAVLTFSADSYPIALENVQEYGLGHSERFTLQFWFYAEDLSRAEPQLLFGQGESEVGLAVYLLGSKLCVYAWSADFNGTEATATGPYVYLDSGSQSLSKTWHHFTLTYDETHSDGIEFRLYIDGKLPPKLGSTTKGFRLDPIGQSCIGGLTPRCTVRIFNTGTGSDDGPVTQGLGFSGKLTDLRIWESAIAHDVIDNDSYLDELHVPPLTYDGMVCYAPLTEDYGHSVSSHEGPRYIDVAENGPELPDQSPNHNDAKLFVGPDDVETKWEDASDLPVFPDRVLRLGQHMVCLPDAGPLYLTRRFFTIELWLYFDAMPSVEVSVLKVPGLELVMTTSGLLLRGAENASLISTSRLNEQKWYHVAWRFGGDGHSLFVDGVVAGKGVKSPGIRTNGPVILGFISEGDSVAWNVSELRVWNTNRSDIEIGNNWQKKTAANAMNLAAYWEFKYDPSESFVDRTARGLVAALVKPANTNQWRQSASVPPTFVREAQGIVLNDLGDGNGYPGATPSFIDLSPYEITEAGTVELWFEFLEGTFGSDCVLFDASSNHLFRISFRAGSLLFETEESKGVLASVTLPLEAKGGLESHVAASWEFRDARGISLSLIFGDREASTSTAGSGGKPLFANPVIGVNRTMTLSETQPFRGKISQVRIWDHVRSFHRLQGLAEADLEGPEAGLVLCLPLDKPENRNMRELVNGGSVRQRALSTFHPEPRRVVYDWGIQLNGLDRYIDVTGYVPGRSGSIELLVKFSLDGWGRLSDGNIFDASTDSSSSAPHKHKLFNLMLFKGRLIFETEDTRDRNMPAYFDLRGVSAASFASQWHRIVASWNFTKGQLILGLTIDHWMPKIYRYEIQPDSTPKFNTLYIGQRRSKYYTRNAGPFDGQVRNIRIWDLPTSYTNAALVRNFALQEGTGTTLKSSVNGDAHLVAKSSDMDTVWFEVGQAIKFSGFSSPNFALETYVDCQIPLPANEGTIELWAQFSQDTGDRLLLDASTIDFAFWLKISNGKLIFNVGSEKVEISLPTNLIDQEWQHIAVVWNRVCYRHHEKMCLKLYLNDEDPAVAKVEQIDAIRPRSCFLGISRLEHASLSDYLPFDGLISELRVWNYERRAWDIKSLRHADLSGSEDGLVMYLPIENETGHEIANRAGNTNALMKLGVHASSKWKQEPPKLYHFEDSSAVVVAPAIFKAISNTNARFEVWVNLKALAGVQPLLGTLSGTLDLSKNVFSLRVVDGLLEARLGDQAVIANDLPLVANSWHLLVCFFDSRHYKLHLVVDGLSSKNILDVDRTLAPFDRKQHMYIGYFREWVAGSQAWNEKFLEGLIAEVRIWSSLDGSDNASIMEGRTRRMRGDEVGLVANWIMTESTQRMLVASGENPRRAYAISPSDAITQSILDPEQQPQIYSSRVAPRLDGYNDYLSFGDTTLDLSDPYSVEFWFRRESTWEHVAAVYGQSNELSKLYLNGKPVPGNAIMEEVYRLLAFVINTRTDQHPEQFTKGQVAEFRLWRGERSAQQIARDSHRLLSGREPALSGYWPLDEGSGAQLADTSEHLAPGALIVGLENAADKWLRQPPPIAGAISALFLDGIDDRVILPDLEQLGVDGSFTLEAWVSLDSESSGSQPLLGSSGSDPTDTNLFAGFVEGVPTLTLGELGTWQGENSLEDGWHHVAWVYLAEVEESEFAVSLFIDGISAKLNISSNDSSSDDGSLSTTALESLKGPVSLGAVNWSVDEQASFLKGGIGRVRLWKIARSQTELATYKDKILPGQPSVFDALAAYWIFDDRNETILLTSDLSSEGEEDENCYYLRWQSDMSRHQPAWTEVTDHPIFPKPLSLNSLEFDGIQEYAGAGTIYLPAQEWTIESWILVSNLNADRPVVWLGSESTSALEIRVSLTGNLELVIDSAVVVQSTAVIPMNTFTHIAAVLQGSTLMLFVNGSNDGKAQLTIPLKRGELTIQIGRSESLSPALFSGYIQEMRIWKSAKIEQGVLSSQYYSPLPARVPSEVAAAWSLSTVKNKGLDKYAPNLVASGPVLVLGGNHQDRIPSMGGPSGAIDARRKVLTLTSEKTSSTVLDIPNMALPKHPHRSRRLIDVFFLTTSTGLSSIQTVYSEQDEKWSLKIFIQSGVLTFEAVGPKVSDAETGPTGKTKTVKRSVSRVTTERIQSNQWHHAAISLDARGEMRNDAFCALLDGQVVGLQPGMQPEGHPATISVGGLEFTPIVGDPLLTSEHTPTISDLLQGQIAEVRVWEADRKGKVPTVGPMGSILEGDGFLLWKWNTSDTMQQSEMWLSSMVIPELIDSSSSSPTLPLDDLAQLKYLLTESEKSIPDLCSLWADLRHIGAADGATLYDSIFNPSSVSEYWAFTARRQWTISSSETVDREIRTRLMSSLRVYSQDVLLLMVQAISGTDVEVITIDGHYLTYLYRIKLLSTLLGLTVLQVLELVDVLQQTVHELSKPVNTITELTVEDVVALKTRTDWMGETGIDISEYKFLVYNEEDNRVRLPYTDTTLVDGSVTLLNAARAFFASAASFASEDVSDSGSAAIYEYLTNNDLVAELSLYIPGADGSVGGTDTFGIVQPGFSSFNKAELGSIGILKELGWAEVDEKNKITALPPFEFIPVSQKYPDLKLSSGNLILQGLIDGKGFVVTPPSDPKIYNVSIASLRTHVQAVFPSLSDDDIDDDKLLHLRDLLASRYEAQRSIPKAVTAQISALQQGLNEVIVSNIAEWLETTSSHVEGLIKHTKGKTYTAGVISVNTILQNISSIASSGKMDPTSELALDLKQLYKTQFLLSQFDLSDEERNTLLSTPSVFGLEPENLIDPKYEHLNLLYTFMKLKADLNDAGNQLLLVLQDGKYLSDLTDWALPEIESLRVALNIASDENTSSTQYTLPVLDELSEAFTTIQTLGADVDYLIDLANVKTLDISFYEKHSTALFELVRAKYDESQWDAVYEPLHSKLASRKRDALVEYILEDLADELGDRKDANVLYEYLLLDVQTGSEVETSRIVQAIASLQLYVQRGLMNLEKGVTPEKIPSSEWEWMKNYRVWEANRKVFLYPENYIEPELRTTKTPFFTELIDDIQQNEVTKETVEEAYKRYLEKCVSVSNLSIVGSYVDTKKVLPSTAALSFDGSGYFTIYSTLATISNHITNALTFSMWVKPGAVASLGGLLSTYYRGTGWIFYIQQNRFKFGIAAASKVVIVESQVYEQNRWYHVAVTFDSNALRLYVNGQVSDTDSGPFGSISYHASQRFSMGAYIRDNAVYNFKGSMRSVAIWNTARTQAQIEASMLFGISSPGDASELKYYWPMEEGTGTVVKDYGQVQKNLTLPSSGLSWATAPAQGLFSKSDKESPKTFYLVGRNEQSKDFFIRSWNELRWEPWEKIDLSIAAESVSPVFAFNRLFLFWVELTDSVRKEDRKWAENDSNGKLLDQVGSEIVLKAKTSLEQVVMGNTITTDKATEDTKDGSTINPSTFIVYNENLNNIAETVNVTVKKPVIKFSFKNFSGSWIQPQILSLPKLEEAEYGVSLARQPKYQRVYAQRWRTSDVGAPIQKDPEKISDLYVARLGPNSSLTRTLGAFGTDEFTMSFWLRVNDLLEETSTVEKLDTHTFTLFEYNPSGAAFGASLTQIHTEIPGKLDIQKAVDKSDNATKKLKNGVQAILSTVNGNDSTLQSAKLEAESSLRELEAAASQVSDGESARVVADKLIEALKHLVEDSDSAIKLAEEDVSDSTLANKIVDVVQKAYLAGEESLKISNSSTASQSLVNAKTDLDAAISFASTSPVNSIGSSSSGMSHLESVIETAQAAEAKVPKYNRGPTKLLLKINGSSKTVFEVLEYDRWYHVAIVLVLENGSYSFQVYLSSQSDSEDPVSFTLSSKLLEDAKDLQIGSDSNPAVTIATGGQYVPWMCEFRVWSAQRTESQIASHRLLRLYGGEPLLSLHVALESEDGVEHVKDESSNPLELSQSFAPDISTSLRERIILFYGDGVVASLRNTLKDTGFSYTLIRNTSIQDSYTIGATNSRSGSSVGYNTEASLIVESYREGAIHPYDRFHPQERNALNKDTRIGDKSAQLYSYAETWNNFTYSFSNEPLLKDGGTGQLNMDETYVRDVHNQPNWYVLDIGDEIFLVRLTPSNDKLGGNLYVQTAEERFRATSSGDASKTFRVYFDRDFALEVGSTKSSSLSFDFLRLNTFAIQDLSERLFAGVDTLLSLESQYSVQEPKFGNIIANTSSTSTNVSTTITASGYYPTRDEGYRNPIDFKGSYGIYYQEIFFHIPLLIANQLKANQKFAEAQTWYHYIFNPTANEETTILDKNSKDRYWRYLPFRGRNLESVSEMLVDKSALEAYRSDPFEPHNIADLRINTYQKVVITKYIENLVEWGDFLFRQDTREALTEATQLYVLAFALLGPRPTSKPSRELETVGTYEDFRKALTSESSSSYGDLLPDFLIKNSSMNTESGPIIPFDPNHSVLTYFNVPENAQFLGVWDTVDDRLYKIRHSLNIDGVFRSLSLFQPEIDAGALVNAAASGFAGSFSSALASGQAVVPHYRFGSTLGLAKEMLEFVIGFGESFTAALEDRSAEDLLLLQHSHELKILEMTTKVKEYEIAQAEKAVKALQVSLAGAQQRQKQLETWINEHMTALEKAEVGLKVAAGVSDVVAGAFKVASALANVVPTLSVGGAGFGGSPVAVVSVGAEQAAGSLFKTSEFWEVLANVLDRSADITGTFAEYERRSREWKQEKAVVENEIAEIEVQIEDAITQVNAAKQELKIHNQEITQHNEVQEFYKSRFFNKEMRLWLSNRLSSLYFQAYKIAYDLAKQAERAYQFEFASNQTYVSYGYWDSRRKGLLAGQSLQLDLMRLEKAAHDQDSRYQEITKNISLARIDPTALLQLRETGTCQFNLNELLFARDFPGHYFRVIRSLSISIPADVDEFENVNATLTQTGHKTLLSADKSGVQYMLGEVSDAPSSVRVDWRANQQIATSTGTKDGGLFKLDFSTDSLLIGANLGDDRYLPFENTGVVSSWILELPKQTNRFDFQSISNVVIHLRYLSVSDPGSFKNDVMGLPSFKNTKGSRLFSLAVDFSAQWVPFKAGTSDSMTLTLPRNTVPYNVAATSVEAVPLYIIEENGTMASAQSGFDVTNPSDLTASTLTVTLTAKSNSDRSSWVTILLLVRHAGTIES